NEGNNEVYIWDVATGKKIKTISFEENVYTAIFNPNDSTLLIALSDKFIIWDLTTNQEVNMLLHVGKVGLLAFNHDGSLLASASSDRIINIWDMTQSVIANPTYQFRQGGNTTALAFNPTKNWLASASENHFVYLFDLDSGEEVIRIPHGDTVSGIDFSSDGKLLATVSRKTIQFFDIDLLSPITKNILTPTACSRVTRNLNHSEWDSFFPQEEYHDICNNKN